MISVHKRTISKPFNTEHERHEQLKTELSELKEMNVNV